MPQKPDNKEDWEYAGFLARYFATLIDIIQLLSFTVITVIVLFGVSYTGGALALLREAVNIGWFFLFNVFLAVVTILLWMRDQATPGKIAISAKIVDAKTGDKPTIAQFVVRYLAYFFSAFPFGIGFLWVAFDKRKQGWHDKLAGTVVLRKKNLPSTAENKEEKKSGTVVIRKKKKNASEFDFIPPI